MMNIEKIEGIGPKNAAALAKAGVKTTGALLKVGATKKGRQQLSVETKLAESAILGWVNRADLMRIKGVGEEYSDLLERAGVDTVKELRNRNAQNLWKAMKEANDKKKVVRLLPSASQVVDWVAQAKKLDPVVKY
jgi:predicted flap endonuclease-1-like 5' DNA nuclease